MNFGLLDQAGKLTQAGLMVLGAAMLGALVIGFAVSAFTTLITGRRLPALVVRWVRIGSALASGVACALMVFGGSGGFGRGGSGSNHTPSQSSVSATPSPPAAIRLGITILGGSRVRDRAFYQLDTDPKPKTQEEITTHLKQLSPGTISLRLYDNSVARDHAAVVELIALAEQNGWRVIVEEFQGQPLPPEVTP